MGRAEEGRITGQESAGQSSDSGQTALDTILWMDGFDDTTGLIGGQTPLRNADD
jgi:hypothetical protein